MFEYRQGQEVYCIPRRENVFIKEIGEIMYFCVLDLGDTTGWYFSEGDLQEI